MLANGGQRCVAPATGPNGPAALVGEAYKFKTGWRDTAARGRRRIVRLSSAPSFVFKRSDECLRFLGGLFKHANHHAARIRIGNAPEPLRLRGQHREAPGADGTCRSLKSMGSDIPGPVTFSPFERGNCYGNLGQEQSENLRFEMLVAERKAAQMAEINGLRRRRHASFGIVLPSGSAHTRVHVTPRLKPHRRPDPETALYAPVFWGRSHTDNKQG